MDLQLAGKRALVLASSQGIGRGSAAELAREGVDVVISSSSMENLENAKETIVADTGVPSDRVTPMTIDLRDEAMIIERVERAIELLGGLDILVTNTGVIPKINFEEATLDQFDDAYILLLKGIIVAIHAALPEIKQNQGVITNLIGTAAQEPEPNHILGNTFRPGIYGLSKSLSKELAPDGVRVNCVCPKKVGPLTQTELDRTTHIDRFAEEHGLDYADARERVISKIIPLGREGDLETFGKAVAFISSPMADHITGAVLNIDGGWSERVF